MKICLLHNLYSPWARGGAEKIVALLAKQITAAGHEAIIISTKPFWTRTPKHQGLKIYYLPSAYFYLSHMPKPLRLVWHIWQVLKTNKFSSLKKILQAEKVEAVLTHNLLGLGFGVGCLIQDLKLPHLHWPHDLQLLHPSGLMMFKQEKQLGSRAAKLYQNFTRQSLGRPDVVIAPSAWILNEHEKRGFFQDSKTIILRNPSPATEQPNKVTKHREFVFLFAGQLTAHKGVDLLIKAFADFLSHKQGEVKLIIAGDGPLLKKLNNQPLPRVSLLGRLSPEEIAEQMAAADCLVVPSLCYENSPGVIYEAAASRLPVIGSDLGGIKELLSEQYRFEPSVKKLSQKLAWAYERRGDLTPPRSNAPTGEEYWEKIEGLLKI